MDSPASLFPGENQRDSIRRPYTRQVFFDFSNYSYMGTIRDISTGGLFIETDDVFKPGQMIMVDIPKPGNETTVRLATDVVRTEPDGIGLRFMLKTLKNTFK